MEGKYGEEVELIWRIEASRSDPKEKRPGMVEKEVTRHNCQEYSPVPFFSPLLRVTFGL